MNDFAKLPKKLTDAFAEIYCDEMMSYVKEADTKKKISELEKELEALKSQCKNSYWYSKTKERRQEIEHELLELSYKCVNIGLHRISGTDKLYKIVKEMYLAQK